MNGTTLTIDNFIAGKFTPPSAGEYLDVTNPADFQLIAKVGISNTSDVHDAVTAATAAFPSWSKMTIKARASIVRSVFLLMFDYLHSHFETDFFFISVSCLDDEIPCIGY